MDYTTMHLNKKPFNLILNGVKKIEIRLNDEKRQKIQVGDTIYFVRLDDEREINVKVLALHKFKTFRELFESELFSKCGCGDMSVDESVQSMYDYYTEEQERQYGVLAIEIEDPLDLICLRNAIKNKYKDCAIEADDIEQFARDLWRRYLVEGYALNSILSYVYDFEETMRENGVKIGVGRQCVVYEMIVNDLEMNEENAQRLYESFMGYQDIQAFCYLMEEFEEWITPEQRKEILDIAREAFIPSVWEYYV